MDSQLLRQIIEGAIIVSEKPLDIANIDSCSFIETQDLGRLNENGSFEILGRFDNSEIRGCNLMVL